nr:hypothetical protein CFP56_11613 [Quercus suber]
MPCPIFPRFPHGREKRPAASSVLIPLVGPLRDALSEQGPEAGSRMSRKAPRAGRSRGVLPVPDRLEELAHVDALGLHLDHPGVLEHAPRRRAALGTFFETGAGTNGQRSVGRACMRRDRMRKREKREEEGERGQKEGVPALDVVFEVVRPGELDLRFVLELGDGLAHDVGEEVDEAGARVHLGAVGGEGEAVLRDFQQRHAERPDVRGDGVGLPGDAFGGHVVGGADEGVGVAFGAELAADAEVAELDLALAREQDVAGLDVAVDDAVAVEVGEAVEHPLRHLAQHLLARPATELLDLAIDRVQTAALAELHRDADRPGGVVHEGTVILADMCTRARFVEGELAHDLLLDVRVGVGRDDLEKSWSAGGEKGFAARRRAWRPYLQGKHRLAVLEDAARHRTARALAQAPELHDPALFLGSFPRQIVEILHIQRVSLLQGQFPQMLFQIDRSALHAILPLHPHARMCRTRRLRRRLRISQHVGEVQRRVRRGGRGGRGVVGAETVRPAVGRLVAAPTARGQDPAGHLQGRQSSLLLGVFLWGLAGAHRGRQAQLRWLRAWRDGEGGHLERRFGHGRRGRAVHGSLRRRRGDGQTEPGHSIARL